MTQRKEIRYTGVLAKRIKPQLPTNRSYAEKLMDIATARQRRADEFIADERKKKLPHLFAHFDVKFPVATSEWTECCELLLRMAIAHVPGFQVEATRGRPKKNGLDLFLYARIRLLSIEKNHSIVAACNSVAKRMMAQGPREPKAATLRRQYERMKPAAAKMIAEAVEFHNMTEADFLRDFLSSVDRNRLKMLNQANAL